MDDDVKASPDSEEVKRRFNNSIFILLGRDPVSDLDSIVKIEKDDKEPVLLKLKKRGCKTVKIIKTDNLNSIWLDDIDVSDVGRKVYQLDDDDKSKYGPFEEVETIDLTKFQIDESKLKSREWKSTMTVVRLPNGRLHIRT